ncbi:MAG: deoxyribodipyrimidine photo-lyase [Myxococcota bacterium]
MRGLHWFRNDLRLDDNRSLSALAERVEAWLPVFVFDPVLLERSPADRPRTRFLLDCLESLRSDLEARGVPLQIRAGRPEIVLPQLAREAKASLVSWNAAPTPLGERRDARVEAALRRVGAESLALRDHTVFGPDEIRTRTGGRYVVYTPYRNAWWEAWERGPRGASGRSRLPAQVIPGFEPAPSLAEPGAAERAMKGSGAQAPEARSAPGNAASLPHGGEKAARRRLSSFLSEAVADYAELRDRPDRDGTSRLSPHLRFGTISVRRCFSEALSAAKAEPRAKAGIRKWLDELVWREFYHAVLAHSPHVLTRSFRPEYDGLAWRDDAEGFEAWKEGRTGYPFVDAGMRQLRATGWMHNRARMVVASFLTKDLLIDWRRGERYFFDALVDGDPASNNGGWQWSASTGTDAQPYFRIFNPVSQGERFDPEGSYVRRWVPELRDLPAKQIHSPWLAGEPPRGYPLPIVDHGFARKRALAAFKVASASKA